MQINDKDAYAQTAELDGLKIVDSSFVRSYLANGWRGLDFKTRCKNLERERKLYEVMLEYCSEDMSYSDEMRKEFGTYGINLKILYDLIGENKEKACGRLKGELENLLERFWTALKIRKDLEDNVLNVNQTENYLYDKDLSYLPVSIVIGSGDDIKKSYGDRYSGGIPRKEHDLYDERIFAKALEIAKDKKVYILTGDSDFIRMCDKFYDDIGFLSELYGFEIPGNSVNIIARFKDSPLLIQAPYERLRLLEKERVYSPSLI